MYLSVTAEQATTCTRYIPAYTFLGPQRADVVSLCCQADLGSITVDPVVIAHIFLIQTGPDVTDETESFHFLPF